MNDIFESWHNQRFIVTPTYLLEENEILIVLTDINFWAENIDNLVDWCAVNNCKPQGMTVSVPNEKTLTLFTLRWS